MTTNENATYDPKKDLERLRRISLDHVTEHDCSVWGCLYRDAIHKAHKTILSLSMGEPSEH